jgi:hypothetical protein
MPSTSKNQQIAAAIALKDKKEGKKGKPGTASANMSKMSTDELEKFAKTKHKGLPKSKKKKLVAESLNELLYHPKPRDTYGNDPDVMVDKTNPVDFASEVFFNEYLPSKSVIGNYEFPTNMGDPERSLDDITADFSTFMEQNYYEDWNPRYDRTIYREIVQEFLSDLR